MATQTPFEEGDPREFRVVIQFSGSRWHAAEKAGLVSLAGMLMSPESAVKARAFYAKRNAETRAKLEQKETDQP